MYEAQAEERRRLEAHYDSKMRDVRTELERLIEENRKLKIDLDDASRRHTTSTHYGGTMDLTDLFPMGIELSSLKRSEWRRLFEQLVAELVRRKRNGHRAVDTVHELRRSTSYDNTDEIRRRVDSLWKKDYTPPPAPPPPRRDADDFLKWGGGAPKRNDADDFLAWGGSPQRRGSDADAFLAFGGGGGGGTTADDFLKYGGSGGGGGGYNASSAADFLSFTGGSGGGGGGVPLQNDASAFLKFANR